MRSERPEVGSKETGMCNHGNFPATCAMCKEAREQSWGSLSKMRTELEKETTPEALARVEKLEIKDPKERAVMSKKIFNFLAKSFGRNEVNSVATNDLILREQISNTYLVKDNRGNIQAYLLSHNIEVPGTEPGEQSKMMFMTWYINTHEKHRGERLTQALYAKALQEFETELKSKGKEFWGLAEEAESDVEGYFNRFHGAKRLYMETAKGIEDVPYLAPPEDESTAGVPEHFMVHLANDRQEMTAEEVKKAFEAVHAQYTDPRFFSKDQLKAEAEDYEIDPKKVDDKFAKDYHNNYKKIVEDVSSQLNPILDKAKEGRVFLMSAEERKGAKKLGKKVIEIQVED